MSKEEKSENSNSTYWSIIEGSFRTQVPQTHPEVIVRHWEAGGESGVKYERAVRALTGYITKVDFYDGESGGRKFTNLNIHLDADENGKTPIISVGVSTRYAQDILKKLPNIEMKDDVRIRPYSFQPEGEDKNVTGVEITQRNGAGLFEKKINSFFSVKEGEKWVAKNGYPTPEGDTAEYSSDDWDIFYKLARRFLVNYTKQHIVPKFEKVEKDPLAEVFEKKDEESFDPAEIPF